MKRLFKGEAYCPTGYGILLSAFVSTVSKYKLTFFRRTIINNIPNNSIKNLLSMIYIL
ncbi:MAG: hypothetical protein LBK06_02185 [Planctomycetaceae bacterium]|nr:hypothetical protein [Planctomycetaceae bacterium]